MSTTLDSKDFQRRLERLDGLLRHLEKNAAPTVQAQLREVVQTVLDLHGAGLERLLGHVAEAGEAGRHILDTCTGDDLVAGLLLLHDLHPLDLSERVNQALHDVRPYLRSHGGNVELLEIEGTLVRLKLNGSCDGCRSSAVTMKQTIEEAILARAPEVSGIEVEGVAEEGPLIEAADLRFALPLV